MILSAMAADPEKRYPTMSAFAEDLELVSGGVAAPKKTAAAPRRNIWQTAFIVLAGMSILAVAFIYATSVKQTDPTTNLQTEVGYLPVQPIGPATGSQEESLAKLPDMTEAEIMAASNSNTAFPMDSLPGGDGYNPWAAGVAPPLGAPLPGSIPPGGQTVTVGPEVGNPIMPSGILYDTVSGKCVDAGTYETVLCPGARQPDKPLDNPSPTPKTAPANTVQTTPQPAATPKTFATPPPKDKPAAAPSNKEKPAPAKTPKSGKQTDS